MNPKERAYVFFLRYAQKLIEDVARMHEHHVDNSNSYSVEDIANLISAAKLVNDLPPQDKVELRTAASCLAICIYAAGPMGPGVEANFADLTEWEFPKSKEDLICRRPAAA